MGLEMRWFSKDALAVLDEGDSRRVVLVAKAENG